jgi:cytochrome P450
LNFLKRLKTLLILISSGGEKWKTRRHLITPSFHFDILNDFLMVMNEQSDIFIDNLTKKSKSKKSLIYVHLSQIVL